MNHSVAAEVVGLPWRSCRDGQIACELDYDDVMLETVFNACEAGLWLTLAVVVGIRYRRAPAGVRSVARVMALHFVLFGVSDLIEIETGAWWRPPALLIFKGACLIGLTCCFVVLVRRERAGRSPTGR